MKRRQIVILFLLLVLGSMVFYDLSLHLVELMGVETYHPFWMTYSTRREFNIFWIQYWMCAFILIFIIWVMSLYEFV